MEKVQRIASSAKLFVLFGTSPSVPIVLIGDQKSMDDSLRPVTSGWNDDRHANFARAAAVMAELSHGGADKALEQKPLQGMDTCFRRPEEAELLELARSLGKVIVLFSLKKDAYDGTAIYYQYTVNPDGTVTKTEEP